MILKGQFGTGRTSDVVYATGVVLWVDLDKQVAEVQLASNKVQVPLTSLRGKSAPPVAGERWLLDQIYGRWLLAVPQGVPAVTPVGKSVHTVGDGTHASFSLPHSLGTEDFSVTVYDVSTGIETTPLSVVHGTTTCSVTFSSTPAVDQYRVVLIG